jgi:hypothetical protein
MIQANELRIGNYFIGYDNKPFKFDIRHFCLLDNDIELNEIIRYPIQLTEEILLKCGFKESKVERNGFSEWVLNDFIFDFRIHNDCKNSFGIKVLGGNYHSVYFNWNTKYLHQLQNLYFALTGSELDIEL